MSSTPEATVAALLSAAGLSPDPDEVAEAVAGYPALRAALDNLHALGIHDEVEPQLVFPPDRP